MANPQLEDGYTSIANEIVEHLMRIQLGATKWQVLFCVWRKTYGWHKKVDRIANSQIMEATGLRKDVVSRALHDLNVAGLLIRNGKLISFQKDWERWKLTELPTKTKKLTELPTELAELPTKVDSPLVTQKKKETIQKKYNNDNHNLTEILSFIKENFPQKTTPHLRDKVQSLEEIYPPGWLLEALKAAVEAGKPTLGYCQGILKDWQLRGFKAEKPQVEYSGKGKKPVPKLPKRWPGQEEKPGVLRSSATRRAVGFGQ